MGICGACCRTSSKLISYIFNTFLFIIGGCVMGVAIYLLVSDFSSMLEEWWVWVSLVVGVVMLLLSILGCWATKSQNRIMLSIFWVFSGALFALCIIVAIGSSVFYSDVDPLTNYNANQLNKLTDTDQTTYEHIRNGYLDVFRKDNCKGGSCADPACDSFDKITCDTSSVETNFNDWQAKFDHTPDNVQYLLTCSAITVVAQPGNPAGSPNAWCSSNIAVIKDVRDWTLGVMIALWIITAFLLLLVVANCVLILSKKKTKSVPQAHNPSTTLGESQRSSAPQGGEAANPDVVHVIQV